MEKIVLLLAKELNIRPAQAEAALQLLDDGNTVPFIARYRKEATGSWTKNRSAIWQLAHNIFATWTSAGKKS